MNKRERKAGINRNWLMRRRFPFTHNFPTFRKEPCSRIEGYSPLSGFVCNSSSPEPHSVNRLQTRHLFSGEERPGYIRLHHPWTRRLFLFCLCRFSWSLPCLMVSFHFKCHQLVVLRSSVAPNPSVRRRRRRKKRRGEGGRTDEFIHSCTRIQKIWLKVLLFFKNYSLRLYEISPYSISLKFMYIPLDGWMIVVLRSMNIRYCSFVFSWCWMRSQRTASAAFIGVRNPDAEVSSIKVQWVYWSAHSTLKTSVKKQSKTKQAKKN